MKKTHHKNSMYMYVLRTCQPGLQQDPASNKLNKQIVEKKGYCSSVAEGSARPLFHPQHYEIKSWKLE